MALLHIDASSDIGASTANKASIQVFAKLDSGYPAFIKSLIDICIDPLPHLKALTAGAFCCGSSRRLRWKRPAAPGGRPPTTTAWHRASGDISINRHSAVWLMDRGYCYIAGVPGSFRSGAETSMYQREEMRTARTAI
jgi:hypothetical protein